MAANALTRAFPKSPRLDKSARNGAQKSTIAFSFCFRNSIDPLGESIDVFLSERKKKKEGERERGGDDLETDGIVGFSNSENGESGWKSRAFH